MALLWSQRQFRCGNAVPEVFDEFKSINTDLSDNGGTLPESYIETYAECDPSATG